jgi:hypothetical protein
MKQYILPLPMVVEEGTFSVLEITEKQAAAFIREERPINKCYHSGVEKLGLKQADISDLYETYDRALAICRQTVYDEEKGAGIKTQYLLIEKMS